MSIQQQVPVELIRYLPTCHTHHIVKLRALVQRNGLRQYALYCQQSGWRGSFIPLQLAAQIAASHDYTLTDIPVARDNRDGCCDGSGCQECVREPCARCGSFQQIQNHHWAPYHLFDDANDWPQSPLCAICHRRWHAVVTPNMHAKRAG